MTSKEIHELRKQIDASIKVTENDIFNDSKSTSSMYIREISIVRTKLQEAKMWAGKCLEAFADDTFPEELKDESK